MATNLAQCSGVRSSRCWRRKKPKGCSVFSVHVITYKLKFISLKFYVSSRRGTSPRCNVSQFTPTEQKCLSIHKQFSSLAILGTTPLICDFPVSIGGEVFKFIHLKSPSESPRLTHSLSPRLIGSSINSRIGLCDECDDSE